jgi:arsenite transporter
MATLASRAERPGMSTFERYLTLWVALCIAAGIGLGHLMPGAFAAIASAEVASVNLIVAGLVWLMIIPMLLKIDFGSLGSVRQHWRGVGVTLFINWAVKPFSMAALGAIFIGWLFADLLPAGQGPSYIAGLILLAAAPCTAMVFVWSNLCDGDPSYTLSHHGVPVRAAGRAAARRRQCHRSVGHAADLRRPLHRRSGDHRAGAASRDAGK